MREVRAARTWTEILLAEDTLTCAVPAIRGMSTRSIPWPDVVDARVIREVDADGAHEHLAVLRCDGGRVWLLNTDFYRQQDIAFAAETLRGRLVGP